MRLRLVIGILGLAAVVPWAAHLSSAATRVDRGIVSSVYDGDTLTLRDGRRVRLLQIDTPELGSRECYSRAARTALRRLAPVGSQVVLETDPALDRTDRYGRALRYVQRGGVNVNLELVRRGDAAPYFYRGERGRYAQALLAAARRAKASSRGLWGACPRTRLKPDRAVDTGVSVGQG
jgi:endonuclease YncB( thermonuclease family)